MKNIKCVNCGASIEMNYDKLIGFCPYCGNQLHFDIDQVEDILKERERTKQVELREDGLTKRAQLESEKEKTASNTKKTLILVPLCIWIFSIIFFAVLSMMTLDNVNFSPYQLVLFLDIIGGIILFKNWAKK